MTSMELAELAQQNGIDYPELTITGGRATGWAVSENGQPITKPWPTTRQAREARQCIRDGRFTRALRDQGVAVPV